MFKKILVTLDGSELAEKVLPHVEALAKNFESEVILFHVLTLPAISASPEASLVEDKEFARKDALEYLERIAYRLKTLHIKARPVVAEGKPADEIVDYAALEEVDVIAMSTHGRSGLGRWVFGSVAERVLRATACPVLLVRVKEIE